MAVKMATTSRTVRSGPCLRKGKFKECLLGTAKSDLQYLQVAASSEQIPPHSGQDFENNLSDTDQKIALPEVVLNS
jgi:hypothetical protein